MWQAGHCTGRTGCEIHVRHKSRAWAEGGSTQSPSWLYAHRLPTQCATLFAMTNPSLQPGPQWQSDVCTGCKSSLVRNEHLLLTLLTLPCLQFLCLLRLKLGRGCNDSCLKNLDIANTKKRRGGMRGRGFNPCQYLLWICLRNS